MWPGRAWGLFCNGCASRHQAAAGVVHASGFTKAGAWCGGKGQSAANGRERGRMNEGKQGEVRKTPVVVGLGGRVVLKALRGWVRTGPALGQRECYAVWDDVSGGFPGSLAPWLVGARQRASGQQRLLLLSCCPQRSPPPPLAAPPARGAASWRWLRAPPRSLQWHPWAGWRGGSPPAPGSRLPAGVGWGGVGGGRGNNTEAGGHG